MTRTLCRHCARAASCAALSSLVPSASSPPTAPVKLRATPESILLLELAVLSLSSIARSEGEKEQSKSARVSLVHLSMEPQVLKASGTFLNLRARHGSYRYMTCGCRFST